MRVGVSLPVLLSRNAISPFLVSQAIANFSLAGLAAQNHRGPGNIAKTAVGRTRTRTATLLLRFLRLLMFNPSLAFCSPLHGSGHFLTGRFTGGIVIKALIPLLPHGFT